MELKKTALTHVHEKLGAKMVPFAGYNMPVRYTSDIEEHITVREAVGVFDVSHMGEFMITGPEAEGLLQYVSSNDVSKIVNGQAQYGCLPNNQGGIVDDLIIYRFTSEKFMVVVNASNIEKDFNWIAGYANDRNGVNIENISDQISLLAVQGPKAAEVLQQLTDIDLSLIKFYYFEEGTFAGVDNIIISGTGYTGSGGFELYIPNAFAEEVWTKIFEAGAPFGIRPIGLGARDTLRLEMGYCLYGNDIDDTTSPLEARLGWITKFEKEFVNSQNLKKQKTAGIKKQLTGFILKDKGIPRGGYEITDNQKNVIGKVTSGTMSPSLRQGIGMGYIQKEYTEPGTEIYIAVRNRHLKAEVVKVPFYKK